jgi:hypothetical protein
MARTWVEPGRATSDAGDMRRSEERAELVVDVPIRPRRRTVISTRIARRPAPERGADLPTQLETLLSEVWRCERRENALLLTYATFRSSDARTH